MCSARRPSSLAPRSPTRRSVRRPARNGGGSKRSAPDPTTWHARRSPTAAHTRPIHASPKLSHSPFVRPDSAAPTRTRRRGRRARSRCSTRSTRTRHGRSRRSTTTERETQGRRSWVWLVIGS
jgi:hypothetical protein